MSSRAAAAGWNTRFSDVRFQGYDGDRGANIFPFQNQDQFTVLGANGAYDGTLVAPAQASTICFIFNVTTPFSPGTTVIVGIPGNTDLFVNLADAVDLTTVGVKTVTREVLFPSAQAVRVTIGGGPAAGECSFTAQVQA